RAIRRGGPSTTAPVEVLPADTSDVPPTGLALVLNAHRLLWELETRPAAEPLSITLPWLQARLEPLSRSDLRVLQTLLTVGCVDTRTTEPACPTRFNMARLTVDQVSLVRDGEDKRSQDRWVIWVGMLGTLFGALIAGAASFLAVWFNHRLQANRAAAPIE